MTRLGQAGFEVGDSAAYGGDVLYGGTTQSRLSLVTSSPAPRTGSYCLRSDYGGASTASTGGAFGRAKRFNHASKTELWYSFAVHLNYGNEDTDFANGITLWRNLDAAGRQNAALRWDGTTLRALYTSSGDNNPASNEVVVIGSAGAVAGGAWVLLDVRYLGATTAVGAFEVWVNGVQALNATSVRTAQAAAAVTDFDLGALRQNPIGALNGVCTLFFGYDDVRWQDTAGTANNGRPGDEGIRLVVPTGAGDLTQLTRAGTDSGANWSQMEELPPSSADYVSGAVVGDTDLYAVDDFPVSAISAVNVLALVANSDGAGGTVYLPTKTGAGQSDGSAVSLTGTWGYRTRLCETDGADGAAWNGTKLSSLQLGVKIAG